MRDIVIFFLPIVYSDFIYHSQSHDNIYSNWTSLNHADIQISDIQSVARVNTDVAWSARLNNLHFQYLEKYAFIGRGRGTQLVVSIWLKF